MKLKLITLLAMATSANAATFIIDGTSGTISGTGSALDGVTWTTSNMTHTTVTAAAGVTAGEKLSFDSGDTVTIEFDLMGLDPTLFQIALTPVDNQTGNPVTFGGAGTDDQTAVFTADAGAAFDVSGYTAGGITFSGAGTNVLSATESGTTPAAGAAWGEVSVIGTDSIGFTATGRTTGGDAYQFVVSTVPEPSSTALLGLGALGFILRRRR